MEPKDRVTEIRSKEVQNIISHIPSWTIRYGISVIFGLIVMLLLVSWLIKYPESIEGKAYITTVQPSLDVVSKFSGKIQKLHVEENEKIRSGKALFEIENPLTKNEVLFLERLIILVDSTYLNQHYPDSLLSIPSHNSNHAFGDLQITYDQLIAALEEYKYLVTDSFRLQNINTLKGQIKSHKSIGEINRRQLIILNKVYKNAEKGYRINKRLLKKNAITPVEFLKLESAFFQKEQELENMNKAIVQNDLTLSEIRKKLGSFVNEIEQQKRQLLQSIRTSCNNLKSSISTWDQEFSLSSPFAGKVSYSQRFQEGDFIQSGQPILTIIPECDDYIGVVSVSSLGAGKIKKGQKVQIKLDNYPYQEYGILLAEIFEIQEVPVINPADQSSSYTIKVKLLNGMTSSYDQDLQYKPRMLGSAKIITEDLRLLERVFYQLRKVINK